MKPMNGLELLEAIDSKGLRGSASAFLSTSALPSEAGQMRLDKIGVKVMTKTDMLVDGGIARLLDNAIE